MDPTVARDAPQPSSAWRKSSRSQGANGCVELNPVGLVRDSKNPAGPVLAADLPELLAAVKSGDQTPDRHAH